MTLVHLESLKTTNRYHPQKNTQVEQKSLRNTWSTQGIQWVAIIPCVHYSQLATPLISLSHSELQGDIRQLGGINNYMLMIQFRKVQWSHLQVYVEYWVYNMATRRPCETPGINHYMKHEHNPGVLRTATGHSQLSCDYWGNQGSVTIIHVLIKRHQETL